MFLRKYRKNGTVAGTRQFGTDSEDQAAIGVALDAAGLLMHIRDRSVCSAAGDWSHSCSACKAMADDALRPHLIRPGWCVLAPPDV